MGDLCLACQTRYFTGTSQENAPACVKSNHKKKESDTILWESAIPDPKQRYSLENE
jgi:hypothetical protein